MTGVQTCALPIYVCDGLFADHDRHLRHALERGDRRPVIFQELSGYTTYKVDLVTREGLLAAIALMLLPFVIFFVLVKLLPPWQESEAHKA